MGGYIGITKRTKTGRLGVDPKLNSNKCTTEKDLVRLPPLLRHSLGSGTPLFLIRIPLEHNFGAGHFDCRLAASCGMLKTHF